MSDHSKGTVLFEMIDYMKDPVEVMKKAVKYLSVQAKQKVSGCVVFDIDDTILSSKEENSQDYLAHNSLGKKIFDTCKKLDLPIILITARTGSKCSYKYLKQQLDTLNISGYQAIYMQSTKDTDTSHYKARIRHLLCKKYKRIVLSCGDQLTDHFDFTKLKAKDAAVVNAFFHPKTYYFIKNNKDPSVHLNLKFIDQEFD